MVLEQKNHESRGPKLKKYLFLISILFFLITWSHLGYKYLYSDAKMYPLEWWTISEWLIGSFPSLNPLEPLSGNNGYFMELLYRSIHSYDQNNGKISSDIASCDTSSLSKIECFIEEWIYWSNWEEVTIDDIYATYSLLKESQINPIISNLLSGTTIVKKENSIVFENKNEDINFLNVFFQPIVPKSTLDNIWKENLGGNFSAIWQIYSGKFKITNVQQDNSLGITKFILEKNEHYKNNPIAISQLIIKMFPDTNTFNKNKETINVFQDDNHLLWTSVPRFEIQEYTLPQQVSLYLNKQTLPDNDFRSFLLHSISRENLLTHLWENTVKPAQNPYFSDVSIEKEPENKNYQNILSRYWYYKKSKLISDIIPEETDENLYSWEVTPDELPEEKTFDEFQKKSETITSPGYVERYNFVTQDDILLTWKTTTWVEAVFINDYKLQGFKSGDNKFYYRLRESFDSIVPWRNDYIIYFQKNGQKEAIEEITFLYNTSNSELEKEKEILLNELYKDKIQKEKESKKEEIENKPDITKERLEKIWALDENFYYNSDLEKLTLDLYYVATDKNLEKTSLFIKNTLETSGIGVEVHPITLNSLIKILSQKDNYDMILAGINLWYFPQNIFPYFHSSQVESGYNFTNIKKTSLDIFLEDLKSDIYTSEEQTEIENKILNILKEEQVVKTLYSPIEYLMVDKSIKNTPFPEQLVHKNLRNYLYDRLYTNEKKVMNLENKNFINYIKYLSQKIYE